MYLLLFFSWFGIMEFLFLFYVASLICCLHTCLFLFASFHTIAFSVSLFLLFYYILCFCLDRGLGVYMFTIFSSEINFCHFFLSSLSFTHYRKSFFQRIKDRLDSASSVAQTIRVYHLAHMNQASSYHM